MILNLAPGRSLCCTGSLEDFLHEPLQRSTKDGDFCVVAKCRYCLRCTTLWCFSRDDPADPHSSMLAERTGECVGPKNLNAIKACNAFNTKEEKKHTTPQLALGHCNNLLTILLHKNAHLPRECGCASRHCSDSLLDTAGQIACGHMLSHKVSV